MKVTFKVEGLSECEEALVDLGRTGKNALGRALQKAGEVVATEASRRAPRLTGDLAESISVSTRAKDAAPKGTARRYVGSTGSFAHLQEFGTAHSAPQPFFRPAIDAMGKAVIETFKRELKVEIDKAIKRQQRKNARLLAKGLKG